MYCTFDLTVVPLRQQCRTRVNALRQQCGTRVNALRCGCGERLTAHILLTIKQIRLWKIYLTTSSLTVGI